MGEKEAIARNCLSRKKVASTPTQPTPISSRSIPHSAYSHTGNRGGTGTDLLTAVGDVRFPRAGTDSRLHLAESIAATGLGCDCHVAVLEEGSNAPKQLFLKTIGRKPLLHPISVNLNRVQEGMAS